MGPSQKQSQKQRFSALDVALAPLVWLATMWVKRRQTQILREGVALSAAELQLARALGVRHAERVRVMIAQVMPFPLPAFARYAARRLGWLSPHIVGMTLGYGIVLRGDCSGDRRLLAHELTHVVQYERLNGIAGFLRQYVRECVCPGYPHGALELEARAAEAQGSMLR